MKIDRLMKRYYRAKLERIPEVQRPAVPGRKSALPARPRPRISWEDAFGAAVTAGWIAQFLMPGHWFLLGRITSVFRVGF
jgi:hypothetical protein